MISGDLVSPVAETADTEDLLEMANLLPRTMGLPITGWVSPRGNAGHEVRIKMNMPHGNEMSPADTAVVRVRPSPHLVADALSPDGQPAVHAWTTLNSVALAAYGMATSTRRS